MIAAHKKATNNGKKGFKKPSKVKVFTKKKKHNDPESVFIKKLQEKYQSIDTENVSKFTDLPLSPKTLKGLKECGYTKPTDIQKATLHLALQGKDILGAAQTGSGKTLAFLIPILENLFCNQWTKYDGLGALVITPTRELAYQIFETLRKIGEHHEFSAGLVIGGKDLKFERNRMDQCNIVICTPGRLLQHMDENPLFDCVNMKILVLDEADRCLDMGFETTMNAIIANLPAVRQTMLFSATQTKSVKDLARLSLKDPSYVAVHEHSEHSTPSGLQQSYVICNLDEKVSILWSFIKNHLKKKIIIFFSSCKQAKYMFEVFSKLRPGTVLMALYGSLHQLKRMDIYENFCKKSAAVLFATDLAARGLDFPEVHWVVQADCPEDSATYIHRVGRTARFHRNGESLLLLLPTEIKIIDDLIERKTPINKIEINSIRLTNPVRKMEAYLASNQQLKDTAQRAFVSYVKSVFLMKDKQIFNVQALQTDSFAHSLGLAIPPRIRFLQKLKARSTNDKTNNTPSQTVTKNNNNKKTYFKDDIVDTDKRPLPQTKQNKNAAFEVSDDDDSENSEDEGILTVKRRDHDIELPTDTEMQLNDSIRNGKKKHVTKAAVAKKILKKNIVANKKIVFDEEGTAVSIGGKDLKSVLGKEYENDDTTGGGIDIEKAKNMLKEEDKFDKQLFKEKVKAKHKEEKRKLKAAKLKAKEDEEQRDDFGDEQSDSGNEPDLSWLPDPDKIYGTTTDLPEFYKPEDEVVVIKQQTKKRKIKEEDGDDVSLKKKTKKKNSKNVKEISKSLSVNEAEELALLLLKK